MKFSSWKTVFTGIGVLVFLISFLLWLVFFETWRIPDTPEMHREIAISRGMTPKTIADTLFQRGIISGKSRFLLAAKWMGVTRRLQAGHYDFSGRLNNFHVLNQMVQGKVSQEKITFPEGIRAREIAKILHQAVHVDPDSFLALVFDPVFTQSLGINAPSLEGYLYPDTYFLGQDISAREILETMVARFKAALDDSLVVRAVALKMTVHQALTLASIIEGEAAIAEERSVISALYHNRLRIGMMLQADPTIQYLIPDGPRRLLKKDLEIDSPYNTYRRAGLPPGPVNNPGIDCIRAALYPAQVPYLYMVANGDGSHTFSRNMDDHIRAKHRFDQVRRRVNGNRG